MSYVTGAGAGSGTAVTGGDDHDHAGGDGAQIDHGGLAGLADNDHSAYALTAAGVTNGDSHDHSGGDGAQIDHGGLAGLTDDDHSGYLLADGTRALTAAWDVGSFQVQAETLRSDVATGTAPLTVASTTEVTNLNAQLCAGVDGDNLAIVGINFIIDGGGAAITTGEKGGIEIPFACTINRASVAADQSGSIVVDIWKSTYANLPAADADSITASAPPTLSTAQFSQDATLTGWTTSVAAGDWLWFNVDSITTVQLVSISLRASKT